MWVLYHNENCSKSRAAREYLTEKGVDFTVINYLETPPTVAEYSALLKKMGLTVDEVIRTNEEPYKAVADSWGNYSEEEKIAYVVKNPILIQRPIIEHNGKAVIGRPLEAIEKLQ